MNVKVLGALTSLCVLGVPAALLMGCSHIGALREAASGDLNCPESRIHIHGAGKSRDVEGCGQRAVYHWTGRDWIRDGQAQQTGSYVPYQQPQQPPPVQRAQPVSNGPQPVRVAPAPAAAPSGPQPVRTPASPAAPPPPAPATPAAPSQPSLNAPLPPSQPPPGNGQSL